MANVTVLNTDAGLSAKTLLNGEDAQDVTGLKTFDRDPSAPFAVSANSAVVTNLDADKLDGQHGAYYTTGVGAMETVIDNADTGTQNNWAPTGMLGHTLIIWNGASDMTVNGIAGGVDGQRVTIKNNSASKVVYFAFYSGSATAGNALLNILTQGNTPIASYGYATYEYDSGNGIWWLVAHEQGAPVAWTPVLTFATPGNLSVSYGSQVGSYRIEGRRLLARFTIVTSGFTHTTASGSLLLTGLPIASTVSSNRISVGSAYWSGITKAGFSQIVPRMGTSVSSIEFYACGSGAGLSGVQAADTPSGGTVVLVGEVAYDLD